MDTAYRRSVVEMEMAFLDTLSMVSLWVGKPKESLFQEIVLFVPEAEGDIDKAVRVRDSRDAILAPAKCSGSGVFMGKVGPRVPVFRVVLPHSRPLPLSHLCINQRLSSPYPCRAVVRKVQIVSSTSFFHDPPSTSSPPHRGTHDDR